MKRKLLSIFILGVMLMSIFGFAFTPKVNAATIGYGFSSTPVPVYADSSFSATYISQLKAAINSWNAAGAGTLLTYAGTRSNVWLVTNGIGVTKSTLNSGEVGRTSVIPNSSYTHIERAVVSLNSSLSYTNNSTTSGSYYLKSVFMHELGHALGLADNYTSFSSIMFFNYTGSTSISSGDLNDINSIY